MQHPRTDCPHPENVKTPKLSIFEAHPENRNKEENRKESKNERRIRSQKTPDENPPKNPEKTDFCYIGTLARAPRDFFINSRSGTSRPTKRLTHRVRITGVPAVASSISITFSLHLAATALLATTASLRALTYAMKSLLSRRNIIRSTLEGNIELRRLPIRSERVEKFLSAWQLVDSIPRVDY